MLAALKPKIQCPVVAGTGTGLADPTPPDLPAAESGIEQMKWLVTCRFVPGWLAEALIAQPEVAPESRVDLEMATQTLTWLMVAGQMVEPEMAKPSQDLRAVADSGAGKGMARQKLLRLEAVARLVVMVQELHFLE
jgi:hypothetical protein